MKTIKRFIPYILICCSLMFMLRCTENIDLKLDNSLPRLVVDGMITNENIVQTIRLSTTTEFFYNKVTPAVSKATVTINNGTSTITLIEKPVNSGIYMTPGIYAGIPGKKYTLNIKLITAVNGQTNYSANEVMPLTNHPDSIKMEHYVDADALGFWEVELYFQDPPEVNFYSFRAYRNDVLLSYKLSTIGINDDKFFNGTYAKGMHTVSLDQEYSRQNFQLSDKIKLQVGSITKNYFGYIHEIQLETAAKDPLFSGPSSNVRTNINNGGMGYFSVCAMSYISTTVND